MEKINTPNDIKKLVKKWKNCFNGKVLFGHLDIVRESISNELFLVDPGSFPEFVHVSNAVEPICNLILNQFKRETIKKR